MKLYYNPLSTYSQKALIAFHEKGIDFEPEIVNLMTPEGRAAYEQVYPIGKVPYLQVSDDRSVPESTSIIEYLDDTFPDTPRLIPGTGDAARQIRFMDRMADLYLNDPVVELLFQKLGFRTPDEDKAARCRRYVGASYAHFNQRLAKQPWLCGEAFSMADCAAIPALYYAPEVMSFEGHPNVATYARRARERPSYARVVAEFEPTWLSMMSGQAAA